MEIILYFYSDSDFLLFFLIWIRITFDNCLERHWILHSFSQISLQQNCENFGLKFN